MSQDWERWLDVAKTLMGLGIFALLCFAVIWPMLRALSQKGDSAPPPPLVPNWEQDEDQAFAPPNRGKEQKQILELARQDPLRTASLVRRWLKDKGEGG